MHKIIAIYSAPVLTPLHSVVPMCMGLQKVEDRKITDEEIERFVIALEKRIMPSLCFTPDEYRMLKKLTTWFNRASMLIGGAVLSSVLLGLSALFVVGLKMFGIHFKEFFK